MTMRVVQSSGIEKDRAEPAAAAVRDGLAIGADIRRLGTCLESRLDAMERRLKAALYHALRLQGGAIAASAATMRFFG